MKKIICFVLIISTFLSLTACHGKLDNSLKVVDTQKKTFDVPDEFDTTRDYEITFWAKNDNNVTQQEIYKKAAEDFQKLYPNIKVNVRLVHDYKIIYQDVLTNLQTNTTPNVCITYPDHIATYLEGEDVVVPLDDFFDDEKYGFGGTELKYDSPKREEVIPKFLDECKIYGNYYAIPYMRSTEACYVNKTYVEKLGYTLPETLTWDFVWEVSEAALKKDENGNYFVNGQNVLIPFMYKSTDNMMIQMLKQKGAQFSNEYGEIFLFNDTTKEIIKTVGQHAKTGAFDTFERSSYPANMLNAGQCIFAIDSTGGATWMGSKAPNIDIAEEKKVDFETAVMTIPQYDTENPQMISQGPSICVFNKEDKQVVLASWLFAQFMITNSVQIAYSQTEGYAPVTYKALDSSEFKDYMSRAGENNELYYDVKIKATQLLIDNTTNTFVTSVFPGSVDLRNAAGYMIDTVNKAVRRKKTVNDSYIESLYKETSAINKLDQIKTVSYDKVSDSINDSGDDSYKDKGKLPVDSVILIVILAICWAGMGVYLLSNLIRKKK